MALERGLACEHDEQCRVFDFSFKLHLMDIKTFVLGNVTADAYYPTRFRDWNPRSRPNVSCPWHEDSKPSLSLGLNNGGARCHACDKRLGNIVHFESQLKSVDEVTAAASLYAEFIRATISPTVLAGLQKSLAESPSVRKILFAECGITDAGISMFSLGWDAATKRLAIPVFDRWNQCINLRLYKPPKYRTKADEALKVINRKGFGGCDLYSWPHFTDFTLDKPVFVMPSEKEMILAMQFGLQAVCATAGEMAWEDSWNEFFTGYEIAIVTQRDDVGRKAAGKKLASLQTVAMFASVIEPPTTLKDFADFVVSEDGQGIHLLAEFEKSKKPKLVEVVAPLQSTESRSQFPSDRPEIPELFDPEFVELASIGSHPEMLNCVVKTQGIVAAKGTSTYTIPWKFKVRCKGETQRYYSLPLGRSLLSFIKASDAAIKMTVRELLDNEKAEVIPCEHITATEVEVIPTASVDKDVPYVTQRCYFFGTRIEANVPYELDIIPTTDARTQETVGLIIRAQPVARAIELATFSEEEVAALQVFQPQPEEDVEAAMFRIAEELSRYHTRIYERPDWHLVALLTWFSPIGFAFPYEKETQRGWLNSLAIGDSQTGKSKVTETLQRLLRAGTFINAENCTYVGLVGGAVKMGGGQFMLRWGRIPLCDKQLVVIEELSGLSVEEISNMSDVRSSGIARLDKGGLSAETNARTRLLALSNVRPVNKNLASYLSGVKAVSELIGHGEDIARFDLIVTLVDREVSNDVINKPFSNKGVKDAIPDNLWQKLCQFAWSLKPNQIKITTDAYYLCLDETKRLSEIYHPAIPIFKGGSGRYKIARVAAAIACLQFSWNGKVILVNEEHVQAAAAFLQRLYDKPSFGYLDWSKQMFDRDNVKDLSALDVKLVEVIKNVKKRGAVVEALVHSAKFTRDELCAVASLQISTADDLIGIMVRERVLRKGEANVWEITPAGRDWMLSHLNDDPMEFGPQHNKA